MSPAIGHEDKHLYEFGAFRLDADERVLTRHSERISLPPKAFDTLLLLVHNHGHVLTKDELLKSVWPDSFVEENNLTQQISQLRRALSDGMDGQSYIETIPKLGYRFLPEVREIVIGDGELVASRRTRTHIVLREEEVDENGDEADTQVVPATTRDTLWLGARWNWLLATAAALLTAVASAFVYRAAQPSREAVPGATVAPILPTAPAKPRYSVAVLGFKNLSGRPEDNWLSTALAEMLATELSAGGKLRVIPRDRVQRLQSDLDLGGAQPLAKPALTQVRNRVGADIVVVGSYVEIGREPHQQIRLDLQLQDPNAGETVYSTAVTGKTQELFALVSKGGSQLRTRLGVPVLSDSEETQEQSAVPSITEAARLYAQGISRLRLFDAPSAEKLLSKAVSVDPDFALGHAALASAWVALGYDEKAKSEARRALDLSLNLSRQEHLLIAGQYSEMSRDWNQAVATYQQLFALFPDNADYGLRLASAQTSAGKGSDALATLEKLRRFPAPEGQDPRIDLAQADASESLGDFKQSLEAAGRSIQSGEALKERLLVARAWSKKSWALRRLGRLDEAAAGLLEAKRTFSEVGDMQGVGSSLRLLGGLYSERGDYSQAERNFQEAIQVFRGIGDRRSLAMSTNGLGIVHYERGDLAGAKSLYEQYLEIEREVGSKVNTAGALGNLANVEDARGNLAEALRLNEESLKIFEEVGDQRAIGTALGNVAILHYEMGDLAGAKGKYAESLAVKQKIGYQRGIAYDLAGIADVLRVEGDLGAAKQKHKEALAIRDQLGEKHNAAASRLGLAALELEDHQPAEAEKMATESAQEFREEKSAADEAAAEEVRARSLLAQDKFSEAQTAIDHARSLVSGAPSLPLSFDIAATSARIEIGSKSPSKAKAAAVAKSLESSLALARKCGYLEYEYKLRLVLGALELQSGHSGLGHTQLEALAKDATEKGFGLIVRDATAVLRTQPARDTQP